MGLRILITNNTLAGRAGSELYVRDIALALQARGHAPILFSTMLGAVAEDLRRATISVVDDLNSLGVKPDVIHGQHHLETMIAVLRFPDVPALNYCHGWIPWEEAPIKFPSVRRYIAVDDVCRDRLVLTHGIPEKEVTTLLNFVDDRRFRLRQEELPPRPLKALIFSNAASDKTHVPPIAAACAAMHVSLDVVGCGVGNVTSCPEELLPKYDLVFAKARAAMEAMASGCAVVLCDAAGLGPLVMPDNFDRLRRLNFGVRTLRDALTPQSVQERIASYSPSACAEVARRVRAEARLEDTVEELLTIYHELIATKAEWTPILDTFEPLQLTSEYLRWIRVQFATTERLAFELEQARAAQDSLVSTAKGLLEQNASLAQQLNFRLAGLDGENRHLRAELDRLLEQRRAADDAVSAARKQVEALRAELDQMARSPAMRLRQRVISVPLVGGILRRVGQRLLRQDG